MAKAQPTAMLLGLMPCSRSVRGCAARSRLEMLVLAAPPTILS